MKIISKSEENGSFGAYYNTGPATRVGDNLYRLPEITFPGLLVTEFECVQIQVESEDGSGYGIAFPLSACKRLDTVTESVSSSNKKAATDPVPSNKETETGNNVLGTH